MPGYQRPVFIRVQAEMEITGTFKVLNFQRLCHNSLQNRKVELVKEGYDFANFEEKDAIYFLSKKEQNYVPLTQQMVDDINCGALKFQSVFNRIKRKLCYKFKIFVQCKQVGMGLWLFVLALDIKPRPDFLGDLILATKVFVDEALQLKLPISEISRLLPLNKKIYKLISKV